jgi:hypothetical protein
VVARVDRLDAPRRRPAARALAQDVGRAPPHEVVRRLERRTDGGGRLGALLLGERAEDGERRVVGLVL